MKNYYWLLVLPFLFINLVFASALKNLDLFSLDSDSKKFEHYFKKEKKFEEGILKKKNALKDWAVSKGRFAPLPAKAPLAKKHPILIPSHEAIVSDTFINSGKDASNLILNYLGNDIIFPESFVLQDPILALCAESNMLLLEKTFFIRVAPIFDAFAPCYRVSKFGLSSKSHEYRIINKCIFCRKDDQIIAQSLAGGVGQRIELLPEKAITPIFNWIVTSDARYLLIESNHQHRMGHVRNQASGEILFFDSLMFLQQINSDTILFEQRKEDGAGNREVFARISKDEVTFSQTCDHPFITKMGVSERLVLENTNAQLSLNEVISVAFFKDKIHAAFLYDDCVTIINMLTSKEIHCFEFKSESYTNISVVDRHYGHLIYLFKPSTKNLKVIGMPMLQ